MTPVISNNAQKVKEMSERDVFTQVLLCCLLIILSPILTFFIFNFWIFSSLGVDSLQSNLYSAFLAVIVLHIALGNLIYRAYFSKDDTVQGLDLKED